MVIELMKKNIKTSPEYLQTWKNFVSRITKPSHIILKYHELGAQFLKRSRVPASLKQTPELKAEDMANAEHQQEPFVPGGPMWPVLMMVIMCIFMLRGISACSLLIEQVEILTDEKTIIVALLKRKNCQEGCPWQFPLRCVCGWTAACPFCPGQTFWIARGAVGGGKYVFVSRALKPISGRALASTFRALSPEFLRQRKPLKEGPDFLVGQGTGGTMAPRPHSARVSGSRLA